MRNSPKPDGRIVSKRPARDFLLRLPLLKAGPLNEIDYEASDPDLLVQIASNAEVCQATIHLGISSIGSLLAQAAPEIEAAEISGDAIESLGRLIAELGDIASVAHSLATACRRYTVDYVPKATRKVGNATP